MASARCFAAALPSNSATGKLRSSSRNLDKKRRRDSSSSKESIHDQEIEGIHASFSDKRSDAFSSIAQGQRVLHERVAAGENSRLSISNCSNELASLRQPLYAVEGPIKSVGKSGSNAIGLRQQHLLAMTAVLQKCILTGDFVRAGRAWGMLLRAEQNGNSFDLRTNNRWGFGAEIILRRETQLEQQKTVTRENDNLLNVGIDRPSPGGKFSLQGFELAKIYYERIVLQYPYRKAFPDTIGPQDFYIAMFGLWIRSVVEQQLLNMQDMENSGAGGGSERTRAPNEESSSSISDTDGQSNQGRESIRRIAFQRANEIAFRLRELVMSPPYSDNPRYSQLQRMVETWTNDLREAHNGQDIETNAVNILSVDPSVSGRSDGERAAIGVFNSEETDMSRLLSTTELDKNAPDGDFEGRSLNQDGEFQQ